MIYRTNYVISFYFRLYLVLHDVTRNLKNFLNFYGTKQGPTVNWVWQVRHRQSLSRRAAAVPAAPNPNRPGRVVPVHCTVVTIDRVRTTDHGLVETIRFDVGAQQVLGPCVAVAHVFPGTRVQSTTRRAQQQYVISGQANPLYAPCGVQYLYFSKTF